MATFKFKPKQLMSSLSSYAKYGQPSPQTHPDLLKVNEVVPKISKSELWERRRKLADHIRQYNLAIRHIVLVPSMDRSYMAPEVPFIYRQHSNMHYLSGFLESDSLLLVDISTKNHTSSLYVKQQSAHDILWEGQRSGVDGSIELTGVDSAYDIQHLGQHLTDLLKDDRVCIWYNKTKPVSRMIHDKHVKPAIDRLDPQLVRSADFDIQSLRVLKSAAELELMRISADITVDMFCESMLYSLDNPHEHSLYAKFDFECRTRGATSLAYLPVVAGGANACTVHYITNNCPIGENELVLVDAGSDVYGYVSDVTRTWSVSGQFTEAQRQLYEAVYEVYESCLLFCKPHEFSLDDIHAVMIAMIAQQLTRLGVVKSSASDTELSRFVDCGLAKLLKINGHSTDVALVLPLINFVLNPFEVAQEVCPHHVGHYLGLDVHDTPLITRSRPLEPAMVICIEPGMYFPKNNELVHKELRGVGIRIEDNFIITQDGHENITSLCPTSSKDIENFLASRDERENAKK